MILGVHASPFTARWADNRLEIPDSAAGPGAGVVDIPVGDDRPFTPRLTRQRADASGLHAGENDRSAPGGGLIPAECSTMCVRTVQRSFAGASTS
jgi:hypothetical protein